MEHYITFPDFVKRVKITFMSLLDKQIDRVSPEAISQNTVYWHETEESAKRKYLKYDVKTKEDKVKTLCSITELLQKTHGNELIKYHSFKIPKKTGGMREINAPEEPLKIIQKNIADFLQDTVWAHNAAHAYIKSRGTVTAIKTHQANNSQYFLKLDIKDFFPNCNEEFVINSFKKIFPFSVFENFEDFEKLLKYAFLNNGLPQGSPCSPVITNIVMVPVDYAIDKMLKKINPKFCYTRYADDMLISCPDSFGFMDIQNKVDYLLKEMTPFRVKKEKTRYGSRGGANWNLGIMLNGDNNITIGHRTKEFFRVKTYQVLKKLQTKELTLEEKNTYLGIMSYYQMVENEYPQKVFEKYSSKLWPLPPRIVLQALREYRPE